MQVKNAWYAVGIGTQPTQMSVTGSFVLCSSGSTYTVNNPPSGTLTWQTSLNISLVSSQGSNPCNFMANGYGDGPGWIQAYFDGIPGPIINVWTGIFQSVVVNGQSGVCPGSLYVYTAQGSPSYSYSWTYPSNWMNNNQYQNTVQLQTPMYNMTYGTVQVSVTNECGTSGYSGITVYPGYGCPHYFTVYPNPASDNVTITLVENSSQVTNFDTDTTSIVNMNTNTLGADAPTNFTVRIYNSQSAVVSTVTRSGKSFSVPLTNLINGTYIIEVSDGKTSYRQPLIVKHS